MARNEAARKVMTELSVTVNDLYAVTLPRLAELQQPANVHFTSAGYRALAEPVSKSILAELAKR